MLIILTQAQIVEKVGAEYAARFAELYGEFLPKVYRYVAYRVNDITEAEDITSAIFEKALTKFNSYSSSKARFSTWIFTIARNTLIDYFRTRKTAQTVDLADPSAADLQSPSPEEQSELNDTVAHLNQCLSRLSQTEQEIISLKFGAEMTNRQIAANLRLSESNVAVILFRSIRKLRDDFRGETDG